jgi:PST family polysaccharide transporter
MDLPLTLIARTRRRVRSASDALLLARVVVVMGLLPLFARLPTIAMLRWLERFGRIVNPGAPHDPHDVVAMVRSCGGLKRWSFQDNCVSQSLTLFTLLARDETPLDVVFGVEQHPPTDAGLRLGRRHVWLERDGQPVFEREPLPPFVVQLRYSGTASTPIHGLTTSGVLGALGVTGIASALTMTASLVRTKVIAVVLGPAGIAASGQVSQATVGLGWLATFGASGGTTRYLAEALAREDERAASTIMRSSAALIAAVAAAASFGGFAFAGQLSLALFGSPDAAGMILWLLPAVPAVALSSVSASMLRGTQQVGRLSIAQSVGAIVAIVAAFVVLRPDALESIPKLASIVLGGQAVAITIAAWPLWKRWSTIESDGLSLGVVRAVAAYGASNVVMGLATAATFLYVGRTYLAAGDVTGASQITALAWFGEPIASILASGLYASTFPAYCAADHGAARRVLSSSARALVLASAPALLVGALFAPVLLPLIFDARFVAVVPLLPLQLLATYGRCVTILLGVPLLARGRVGMVTALHLSWTVAVAVGATAGLGGPRAYTVTISLVTLVHAVVLAGVLAALKLSPARADYAWLAGGAVALVLGIVL